MKKWQKTWEPENRQNAEKARRIEFLSDDILLHYRGEYINEAQHQRNPLDLELCEAETGAKIASLPKGLTRFTQLPAKESYALIGLSRLRQLDYDFIFFNFAKWPDNYGIKKHIVEIDIGEG